LEKWGSKMQGPRRPGGPQSYRGKKSKKSHQRNKNGRIGAKMLGKKAR